MTKTMTITLLKPQWVLFLQWSNTMQY